MNDGIPFVFNSRTGPLSCPDTNIKSDNPEEFAPGREIVRFVQDYATFIKAPTRCGVEVTCLERSSGSERYLLTTNNGSIEAANVVIATGPYQRACDTRHEFRCS